MEFSRYGAVASTINLLNLDGARYARIAPAEALVTEKRSWSWQKEILPNRVLN